MRLGSSFARRTRARAGRLAPVAGMVGTAYGIRHAFSAIDASGHATSSVVPGAILAALLATVTGLLLIIPLAAVWEVLRRGCRR